jgi:hypothetical protein
LEGGLPFFSPGPAATSTDELMRVTDVGGQSMHDTFGDKRTLFVRALEMYVTDIGKWPGHILTAGDVLGKKRGGLSAAPPAKSCSRAFPFVSTSTTVSWLEFALSCVRFTRQIQE